MMTEADLLEEELEVEEEEEEGGQVLDEVTEEDEVEVGVSFGCGLSYF